MNFTKLIINNFLTIGHAEINLKERGLLLIQGDNKDDSSADSNGAGKSSIADAICWALYGVTARGVSTDAVVNKTAKKDCSVELWFEDSGEEYRIVRHRKDTENKNATFVQQKGAPGALATDLHKGTERETQEVINGLVGCSLEVFQAAVYAGQEKMPDLPSMTDKQLKLMIEEAAGVEVLAKAHQIARDRLNTAKTAYTAVERETATLAAQLSSVTDSIVDEDRKHTEYEGSRKPLAKMELAKVVALQAEDKKLEAEIAAEEAKGRDKELADIANTFASLKGERDRQDQLNNNVVLAHRTFATAEASARNAKTAHTNAVEALRTVDEKVGTPCGECGKDYCEHDVEAVKTLRKADLEAATKHLREVADNYKNAKEGLHDAQKLASDHKASMTDVTAMAARQKVLQDEEAAVEKLRHRRASIARDIAMLKTSAKNIMEQKNPYEATAALLRKQQGELMKQMATATERREEIEAEVELLEDAVKVYGPAGVRAHVLDTVTPYLNDRTSHYLAALADDNIHAVWNTLTTNAKGELKEKFNIEVKNDKGAESFEGMSGGEKRKVRLATAMALQDMVASRATKPINIFIADEVDHALDESGLERLMTVLNEKAKERGTVLVISHNSLSDWIDEVITVTKEAGYGKVSGAC